MKRKAEAVWKGSGLEGKGSLNTPSGVFKDQPYSAASRFKNEDGKDGTNPEELIAAAHAGCFNMALSFGLGGAGYTPSVLHTEAIVTIEKQEEGGWAIEGIELNLTAKIPDISEGEFLALAHAAETGCPISKALSAVPLKLNAELLD